MTYGRSLRTLWWVKLSTRLPTATTEGSTSDAQMTTTNRTPMKSTSPCVTFSTVPLLTAGCCPPPSTETMLTRPASRVACCYAVVKSWRCLAASSATMRASALAAFLPVPSAGRTVNVPKTFAGRVSRVLRSFTYRCRESTGKIRCPSRHPATCRWLSQRCSARVTPIRTRTVRSAFVSQSPRGDRTGFTGCRVSPRRKATLTFSSLSATS